MKISIIIVSYNVKYFLDQCLTSILQSDDVDDVEIIIVDNNSNDGTVEYLRSKYQEDIRIVANEKNVGFSKANNQGVELATGEYILILNPDTLLSSDTLNVCLDFLTSNTGKKIGIVGTRMYDGSGTYLPESKRGFPSPFVSFCKIFGLSRLFPKSRLFNRYYLGHLDELKSHEVPILTGAFMFLRKDVFNQVGGFDEQFFMYGEDIDLSYRVEQAGYTNYYLADSKIIHYKGESTRKLSFNYVRRFYVAMIIFARKHFGGRRVFAYTFAIKSAIYLNLFFTFLLSGFKRFKRPILDVLIFIFSYYVVSTFWQTYYFDSNRSYPMQFYSRNVPIYVTLLITVFLLLGKYHKRFMVWRQIKYAIVAMVLLLATYSLLPSTARFSRAVVVIGATLGFLIIMLVDLIRARYNQRSAAKTQSTAIVGSREKADRLLALLDGRERVKFVGFIKPEKENISHAQVLGTLDAVESIVRFHGIEEIIFNLDEIDSSTVMRVMTTLDQSCQYKIYTAKSDSVVGSYSKDFRGQIDAFNIQYAITTEYNKFIKRVLDISLSVSCILFFPLLWLLNKFQMGYWKNIAQTLQGKKTWVGYIYVEGEKDVLPAIKDGILPHVNLDKMALDRNQKMSINFIYAREYSAFIDLRAFCNQLTKLYT